MLAIIVINSITATTLQDRRSRIRIPIGARDFSLLHNVQRSLWCPSSLLFNGYRRSLPRGSGQDVKLTTIAEVKNEWSYTSTPYIRLLGVNRGNFMSVIGEVNKLPRAVIIKGGVYKAMFSLSNSLQDDVTVTYVIENKGFMNTNTKCRRMHSGAL
jgi:hypothetical protein